MRTLIIAGLAAATLTTAATAQETCEQRRENRTVGTVAGAGIGALLGGVIGGNGLGVALGAVGGGVAGNQLARGPEDCVHAYGYYDNGGRWHGNRVDPAAATGFYDRDGRWVAGAPAGYYDRDGRWVPSEARRGYRDGNGYWVAAGAPGYYAENNYVTAQAVSGNDQNAYGRPAYGNDQNGDGRPGYGGDRPNYDPRDIDGRISRIAERIDRSSEQGLMRPDQAERARADLRAVHRQANAMPRRYGQLSSYNQGVINARLDDIDHRIRDTRDLNRDGAPPPRY